MTERSGGVILISYDPVADQNKVAATIPGDNVIEILKDIIDAYESGIGKDMSNHYLGPKN